MPAPNPYTSGKGDVLDQALHVARTQAAGKGATGFFNDLKPNDTTDFQSTSRINVARPAAQATRNAKVVPAPKRQAQAPAPTKKLSSAQLMQAAGFHPSSIGGLANDAAGTAKTAASTIVHHPVQTALAINPVTQIGEAALGNPLSAKLLGAANKGVNTGLAKLAKVQQGPNLQGSASTNAGILNALQGVPTASLSPAMIAKAKSALSFFGAHPQYKYNAPNLGIYNAADKAKAGLPPTATDADVIRKAYAPFTGHRDGLETLIHNIPLNAVQLAAAPVGAAYLASQTAQGNLGAAKEAGEEQVQFAKDAIEHPIRTAEQQPVTFATSLFGAGRALGGLGGTLARTGVAGDAARAFATPAERNIVPNLGANPITPEGAELQPHAINRGMTSPKLDERVAQAVADKLATGTKTFGKRLQRQQNDAITKTSLQKRDALVAEHVNPAIEAAAKLSPTEERATRFIHGQALGTPDGHAAFMRQQADAHRASDPGAGNPGHERWAQDQRTLDDDAALWTKVAANRKVGDTPTAKQQDYLNKAAHANRFAEQDLATMNRRGTSVPLVSSTTALRSAYAPAAAVRGIDVTDTAAMNALRAEHRASIGAPEVAPNSPLDEHDPLYNPHQVESPKAMRGLRRGDSLPMMHDNPATRFGNRRLGTEGEVRTGAMIPKGQATSSPHVYFGALAKPLHVAAALDHFRAQGTTWIRDVPAGTAYDTNQWVRVRDNHNGLPNADVHTATDTHEATAAADDSQTLRQQIMGGVEADARPVAHIPEGGTYHLAPKQSINNLENRLKSMDRGTLAKIAKTGTGLWRWTTLMARPAWLVNNVAGNVVQASIAGAGPGDWVKAFKQGAGGHPVEGVENAGQFKNVMQQKPTLGTRALRPVHAFTNEVVNANVKFENLARRAVANHALRDAAKAHVHGEIGTIRSSFHHTSDAVRNAMDNPTPQMQQIAVKEVDRALGNFVRAKQTPGLDLAAPFHRWFTFIAKYTAEMPARTPGRALILQRLGQLGINVQNQQFGGFQPNSLVGSVPIAGGLYKSTQGLNPLASLFQLADLSDGSTTDQGQVGFGGLAGATNPLLMAIANTAEGKDLTYGGSDSGFTDQYGNPAGPFNPRVFLNQVENSLPFVSLLQGSNTADTSINPLSPQQRTAGALTQKPTPFADRAIGYLGGSVRPYDPQLNQVAAFKRLVPALKTEARNRAKNG